MSTKAIVILVVVVLAVVAIFIVMKKSSDKKEQEIAKQQAEQAVQPSLGDTLGGLLGMFATKGINNVQSGKTVFGKDKKTKDSTDDSGYISGDGWINLG